MGCVVNITPRPIYPRERLSAHCTGGWVGPRAVMRQKALHIVCVCVCISYQTCKSHLLCHIVLPSAACLGCIAFFFFYIWSRKWHDFRKNEATEHKICIFDFPFNFYLKYFSFLEEFREIYHMYAGVHVQYPLSLSDLNETWIFSTDLKKK